MSTVYSDLSDVINKTKWNVLVEDGRELKVPYYYQKFPERRPFYSESNSLSKSVATIHQIISMCNSEIVFSIPDEKDFVSIYKYLKEYSDVLSKNINKLPATHRNVRYYKKCKVALEELEIIGNMREGKERKQRKFEEEKQIVDILKHI
jgi:hypothetical protein